ncbi:MAG: recombination protein NinB [Burkholderiales bacterium]|nr:recombination protein NinB [Burkholderiales bacterium]
MSDRLVLSLREPVQAHKAFDFAWKQAKALLMAGHQLALTVAPETRRDNHNRHFHSLIAQISEQVGGDLADKEDAKRILISAFRIDTRDDSDLAGEWAKFGDMRMGRGLRGEVVLMGMQSRDFTIRLARAFIQWLYALGAEQGVQFKAWEDEQ